MLLALVLTLTYLHAPAPEEPDWDTLHRLVSEQIEAQEGWV